MELDANKLKKIHTSLVLDIFKGSAIKWSNGRPLLENQMAISLVAMAGQPYKASTTLRMYYYELLVFERDYCILRNIL